jgi:hypothetical protein
MPRDTNVHADRGVDGATAASSEKRNPPSFLTAPLPTAPTVGQPAGPPAETSTTPSLAPATTGATTEQARAARLAVAPATSPPTARAPAAGGWKMPVDIMWPTAVDVGTLPQSDFRNQRFKLITSITEGPWVVRAAVRATPTLLGTKVVQRYFRGDDYLEIDVHVGSSVIASNIVGVCRGYARHVINDCAVVVQGESAAELSERVLACVSLNHIDMNIRNKLD